MKKTTLVLSLSLLACSTTFAINNSGSTTSPAINTPQNTMGPTINSSPGTPVDPSTIMNNTGNLGPNKRSSLPNTQMNSTDSTTVTNGKTDLNNTTSTGY